MAWRLAATGDQELRRCYREAEPEGLRFRCVNRRTDCFFNLDRVTCGAPIRLGRSPLLEIGEPSADGAPMTDVRVREPEGEAGW